MSLSRSALNAGSRKFASAFRRLASPMARIKPGKLFHLWHLIPNAPGPRLRCQPMNRSGEFNQSLPGQIGVTSAPHLRIALKTK
jgi:hypothetical protein